MSCFCTGSRKPDIRKFIVLLVHVVGSTPPSALRHSTPFAIQLVQDFLKEHTKIDIRKVSELSDSTRRASPIHTTMKDVTLVSGIKDWTGDSRSRTVHEFFAEIDTYAKVSNWAEDEKALITKAKLQGIALQFVQGREFLSNDACPYAV